MDSHGDVFGGLCDTGALVGVHLVLHWVSGEVEPGGGKGGGCGEEGCAWCLGCLHELHTPPLAAFPIIGVRG